MHSTIARRAAAALLPDIEQARARAAGGLAQGRSILFLEQQTADAAPGGPTAVIGPSSAFKPIDPLGDTIIEANITGLLKAGVTSASAAIEFSDNAGVTWTAAQSQPIPGTNAGGAIAADTVAGASLLFRFANSTFPAGGREFRVTVTPVAAHFTTLVNQGSMVVEEV